MSVVKGKNTLVVDEMEFEKMFHAASMMPNAFCWHKDIKSRYISCNDAQAAKANLDSPKQIVGKSDFDLCWKSGAKFYQTTDHLVLNGDLLYTNQSESVPVADCVLTMLVTKYQLINIVGEPIGVVGVNVDATAYCLVKKAGYFDPEKKIFYLGSYFDDNYLTKRELDVLRLLLCGYTAKKIGISLKISYRTAESYINILKTKLGCESKSDIIVTAIKNGLAYLLFE